MSRTFAEFGLPEPRFNIGQVVYTAYPELKKVFVDCPDCQGTKKWKISTPAGEEFEVNCQRCSGGYLRVAVHSYLEPSAYVVECTIGSMELNTWAGSCSQDGHYKYMCKESGIGSGSVYYENALFPTREAAELHAALLIEKQKADPRSIINQTNNVERKEISYYTLENAKIAEANAAARETARKLERLLERLAELEYETFYPTYDWQRNVDGKDIILKWLNPKLGELGLEKIELCRC